MLPRIVVCRVGQEDRAWGRLQSGSPQFTSSKVGQNRNINDGFMVGASTFRMCLFWWQWLYLWKPAWWYCLGHSPMIQPGSSQSAWRCSWEWLLYQCPMSWFGIWTLVVQFHFGSILDLRLDRCIIKWSQGFPNASTILTVEGISYTAQYAQSFLLWVNGQSVNRPLSSTVTAIAKAQHV